jgi:hypothetical protein
MIKLLIFKVPKQRLTSDYIFKLNEDIMKTIGMSIADIKRYDIGAKSRLLLLSKHMIKL